jgi:predicted phosphodiesterase
VALVRKDYIAKRKGSFMSKKTNRVLVISDLQIPYHHPDAFKFLKAVKKKYKPNHILNIGDTVDNYCLSAWVKSPEAESAGDEINRMLGYVKELGKIFPKMEVLLGNHCMRIERAAVRAGIPMHFIKNYGDWMGAPKGWNYHEFEYELDNVLYTHGNEGGAGGQTGSLKRAVHYGMNSVSGHTHSIANINYFANRTHLIWGMSVGSLVDRKQIAFAYCKTHLKKPVLTTGMVVDGVPMLIPMVLNDKGRWVGKL